MQVGSSHTSILFLGQQKDLTSRGLADVPLGSMAAHNSRMARDRDAIPGCADAHAGVSHTYEGRSTVDLAGLARSHIFAGGGVKHAPARTNVNLSLSGSPCKELPLLLTGSSIVMAAHGWHMGFLRQMGLIQRRWIAHRSQLALIYDWRIQRSSELIPGKGADRQNLPPASLRRPPAPSPSEGDRTKRDDMRSQKFPNRHRESLPKVQASKRCPLKGWEGTGQKSTSDISKGRSEPCRDVQSSEMFRVPLWPVEGWVSDATCSEKLILENLLLSRRRKDTEVRFMPTARLSSGSRLCVAKAN